MNRIYKVIYSKARQCYIVVSELAKSNHKSSQQGADHTNTPALARIIAVALAAGALTWGSVPEVSWAADAQPIINDKGIIVGKNQNIDKDEDETKDFIVIGSLSSDEQKETDRENHPYKYMVKRNSIVLGHHASNTMGESIVIGNRSQANGNFQTIMGHRSIIKGYADQQEGGNRAADTYGALSSIYGAFNTIESARPVDDGSSQDSYFSVFKSVDGFGSSINGTMNKTSNARGTMIMGAANIVTHSQPDIIKANVFGTDDSMDDIWLQDVTSAAQYYNLGDDTEWINYDQGIAAMKEYAANASGAVSVLGNGNAADYAIRSQILGTANTLTGNQNKISANNTINGYGNTGTNITHSAVVGSNNTLSNGEDNVVIGDYHNMDGGKHNVVLGSMKSEGKNVTKKYVSPIKPDMPIEYTVTEQVPVKDHKNDIENAVMVGYNTDATVDGGVALGSESVASTKAGIEGYNAQGKKHSKSDNDYAAWVSTDAAVSVGGADREVKYKDEEGKEQTQTVKSTRQITNLAAGTQNTDAVNVAQLQSVFEQAEEDIAAAKTHFYSVNSKDAKAENYNNDGATGADALAAGVGAKAEADHSIAIGTNAWTNEGDSRAKGSGDIAIGNNSKTGNYVNQSGSIAIGQNAETANMAGNQEAIFAFGQTKYSGSIWSSNRLPDDASKVPTAIAIGQNSYARTGGLMIGTHNYNGKLGDVTVNSNDTNDVNAKSKNVFTTTLGTNSYNAGAFSTVTGAYSIASGNYNGGRSGSGPSKNFGATITGSLNSIESATSSSPYSGIANSIVGTANSTSNSNGSLVFGAGNTIKNSVTDITNAEEYGIPTLDLSNAESAKKLQDNLMTAVRDNKSGGAALVIGGGNTIDRSIRSQVIGVNNKLTGNTYHKDWYFDDSWNYHPAVEGVSSQYNMIDGYNNTAQNVNHAYVIGANNIIQGKKFSDATKNGVLNDADWEKSQQDDNLIVIGDNHTLANDVANDIILGTADADKKITTSASNAVMIGHNADVQKNGGVALGADSVASVDKDVVGYDPLGTDHSGDTTGVWKSKVAAVSVGDKNLTRQITNVAAGKDDTDAVNVAQLKNLQTTLNGDVAKAATEVKGDKNVKATPSTVDGHTLYTLGLADTVTIGSDNAKAVKIDGTTGEVSGLSNITWDKDTDYSKSTKAATEAQLQKAMKDVQTAAESKDTDTHVKAGTYAVTTVKDAAGKDTQGVALDVVDKAGTPVDKVTITDVAKASDVGDVSKLATGSNTVVDAINNVNTKVDTVDKKVDTVDKKVGDLQYGAEGQTNVVKNGDSVTKAIGDLDKAIGNASTEAGKHTIVSTKDRNLTVENVAKKGEAANYQLALNKDITVDSVTAKTVTSDTVKTKNLSVSESASIGDVTINKGNQGTIDGLKNTAWDAKNITSGRAATEDQVKAATKNAVNYDDDTSKTITLREDTTIKNVANTSIEQGSKNAVNAGTVYNETRVKQDGKYVKASNTAGENLSVLDNQVASNSSNITNLNGRVNNLDSKVNKVGAGAAALAALHPLDFDPEDKWDFAVGYGNYRDANSVAVGAFYRPDDDTMFSVGTNFGNGENMINAGVSFKFGPKGKSQVRPGSTQEITELRATVARQDDQLKKQDNEIKELKAMVQQLMAKQDKQATTK